MSAALDLIEFTPIELCSMAPHGRRRLRPVLRSGHLPRSAREAKAANDNMPSGYNHYFHIVGGGTDNPATARRASLARRSAKLINDQFLDLTRGKVTNILSGAISGDLRTYAYDGIGRLTSSTGPWSSGTYSYDALGNIWTKTEGSRALVKSYDAKNRLVSRTDTGGPNRTLNYEARGNVTQLGGLFFTYDRSDQSINISGTASGTYRYDGHNRRVKAVVDGKTIYNIFDQSGTLVHIDKATDSKKIDYIEKFLRIKTENGTDTPTYLHMERHCRGLLRLDLIHWIKNYRYAIPTTKHIKDSATGLTYIQARYYDPLIGRFLSTDPIRFSPDKPQMFNRYAYVNNDPMNLTDPTGQCPNCVTAAIGAGIGTVFGGGTSIISQARSGNGISWGRVGIDAGKGFAVGGATGFAGPGAGAAVAAGLGGLDGGISTALDGGSTGEIAANALDGAIVEGALTFVGGKVGEKILGPAIAPKLGSLVKAESIGNAAAVATGVGLQGTLNAGGELAGAVGQDIQNAGAAIKDAVSQLPDMARPEPMIDLERD